MPRTGKTEEDWSGLKLGFLKTVQPNSFSKLIPATCNFKNDAQETFVCLGSLIFSFTCKFFAYFKFHSDWGQVIGKIKQNELDCRDRAPLIAHYQLLVWNCEEVANPNPRNLWLDGEWKWMGACHDETSYTIRYRRNYLPSKVQMRQGEMLNKTLPK